MPKIEVAGREFHYERAGSGEPLLLIQGMSGPHVAWGEPFKGALEEGFDVVAFDNRGIGHSAPVDGPFTIDEMAANTAGLLEALGWESARGRDLDGRDDRPGAGALRSGETALADARLHLLRRARLDADAR